jgi:hypothetical protein
MNLHFMFAASTCINVRGRETDLRFCKESVGLAEVAADHRPVRGVEAVVAPWWYPASYTVTLAKRIDGVVTPLPGSQTFEVIGEGPSTREDRTALSDSKAKLDKSQQALTATQESATEARTRLEATRRAVDATPALSPKLHEQTLALERQLDDVNLALRGDTIWRSHNEGVPESIAERVRGAASPTRGTTGHPTKTDGLAVQIPKLRRLLETDIKAIEKQLDAAGAPPTHGRLPDWKPGK